MLNPCRCGNRPERVTTSSGLVRISCVLTKCDEIVCARPLVAERAWNEANPLKDEDVTLVDCDSPVFEGAPIGVDELDTHPTNPKPMIRRLGDYCPSEE